MEYHFDALGADRFQNFCQALLMKKYERVQCFPTGQPDGGRDASQRSDASLSDTVVFQVKFSKDPRSKTERDVIESLIQSEKAKILDLVRRGAKQYVFMTNVKGTAHQDSGSIDRINKILTDAFSIPVFCYWEDELSRELDSNSDLKWSYLEVIKATDLLEYLIFSDAIGLEQNQKTAIKSFLATQYREDAKLKFKQVEIKEDIIDLFVDVPADISIEKIKKDGSALTLRKNMIENIHAASNVINTLSVENQEFDEHSMKQASAYQILTNSIFVNNTKRVVVEGAPGQGKSTVTQFLSQVHRLAFLGKDHDLARLNPVYRPKIAALPIKVDIRDYATWLSGFNPFVVSEVARPTDSSDALESFLSWMVAQTTGTKFTADHLNTFFSNARLLVVLDGFDEVAEIALRERIVEQVSCAADRLETLCIDFQLIVTSRPAAFANSPGFPRDEWTYVQLQSLTRGVINQYANQWLGGGIKDEKDKAQILAVLNEKLGQSHIRDLARNPMQLAILLSLISVQGASLPDQRTALYDRYIDIFFNRESDKSDTVRDNRATLIEIHQYLAWKLHSESEIKGDRKTTAGSISKDDLVITITNFLVSRGHDASIVNELFTGMVERVVALVSRTQDTFEFEVQPLREYFTARWLYATSPYSPQGRVVPGTKTERFDAIARNFYWQNVARFMAGCYDMGELASLEECVTNLSENTEYSDIAYPAFFGMTLLGDYIFEQQPRLANRLVVKLLQTRSFKRLMEREPLSSRSQILDLTVKSGRENVIEYLKQNAPKMTKNAIERHKYCRPLRGLLSDSDIKEYWYEQKTLINDDHQWLVLGSALSIYRLLSEREILELHAIAGGKLSPLLANGGRLDIVDAHPKIWREVLEYYLETGLIHFGWFSTSIGRNDEEAKAPEISRFVLAFLATIPQADISDEDAPQASCIGDLFRQFDPSKIFKDISHLESENTELCQLYNKVLGVFPLTPREFLHDINLVDSILFEASEIWGLNWFIFEKALLVANMIECGERSHVDEFAPTRLLSFALGLKCGELPSSVWKELIENANAVGSDFKVFIISAMLSWSSDSTIFDKSEEFVRTIGSLSEFEVDRLIVLRPESKKPHLDILPLRLPENLLNDKPGLRERIFRVLYPRLDKLEVEKKLEDWFQFKNFESSSTLRLMADFCLMISLTEKRDWPRTLLLARECGQRNIRIHGPHFEGEQDSVPEEYAHEILNDSEDFPVSLVTMAERTINNKIGRDMKPIAEIAIARQWFDADGFPEI